MRQLEELKSLNLSQTSLRLNSLTFFNTCQYSNYFISQKKEKKRRKKEAARLTWDSPPQSSLFIYSTKAFPSSQACLVHILLIASNGGDLVKWRRQIICTKNYGKLVAGPLRRMMNSVVKSRTSGHRTSLSRILCHSLTELQCRPGTHMHRGAKLVTVAISIITP